MLLGKNFEDIDEVTIQALVAAGATESIHLEFKETTYGNNDDNKREFRKDISAFANTLGGHLIIGIKEADGAAYEISPLSEDKDAEILRLENLARSAIEPALIGFRIKPVPVSGGYVIVIHVPRSYNPPHRVRYSKYNLYYMRGSARVYEPSLEELRRLFGEQRRIEEQAEAFIDERLQRGQSGASLIPVGESYGCVVVHIVPLPNFTDKQRRIEIEKMQAHKGQFQPMIKVRPGMVISSHINLEGFKIFSGFAYTQIFRNGTIEAINANIIRDSRDGSGCQFASGPLSDELRSFLSSYMSGLRALEVSLPALLSISFIGMSFIGMRRVSMSGGSRDPFEKSIPYNRAVLLLPDILITEYADNGNYDKVMSEQMDFLWNAFGYKRGPWFNENGEWIGCPP